MQIGSAGREIYRCVDTLDGFSQQSKHMVPVLHTMDHVGRIVPYGVLHHKDGLHPRAKNIIVRIHLVLQKFEYGLNQVGIAIPRELVSIIIGIPHHRSRICLTWVKISKSRILDMLMIRSKSWPLFQPPIQTFQCRFRQSRAIPFLRQTFRIYLRNRLKDSAPY